jgi:hypothetical protein
VCLYVLSCLGVICSMLAARGAGGGSCARACSSTYAIPETRNSGSSAQVMQCLTYRMLVLDWLSREWRAVQKRTERELAAKIAANEIDEKSFQRLTALNDDYWFDE